MKYLVIGLGIFGRNLASNLTRLGAEVIALDRKEENVSAVKDEVCTAATIPFDDPGVLSRFPIDELDAVLIAIGDDFEASMAFTVKAQELGAKRLVCRVLSPMHERLLGLLKVDRVVVPEEFAARGLAHSLLLRGAVNGIDLGSGHALVEVAIPPRLVGQTITSRLDLFKKHNIRLVTIKRPDDTLLGKVLRGGAKESLRTLGTIAIDQPFKEGDLLVLFGPENGLRPFIEATTE
jgi:trk system potassium uptake protein